MSAKTRTAALVLTLAVGVVGCGDGDSNGDGGVIAGPADEFLGWWVLAAESSFILNCPTSMNGNALGLDVWIEQKFERGDLTDLFDTSLGCVIGLGYDVEGTTATVPNPDPYTGTQASCVLQIIDPTVTPLDPTRAALLEILPPPTGWAFTLMPRQGDMPREAQLGGTSPARLTTADASGQPVVQPMCTYSGLGRFLRLTKS